MVHFIFMFLLLLLVFFFFLYWNTKLRRDIYLLIPGAPYSFLPFLFDGYGYIFEKVHSAGTVVLHAIYLPSIYTLMRMRGFVDRILYILIHVFALACSSWLLYSK